MSSRSILLLLFILIYPSIVAAIKIDHHSGSFESSGRAYVGGYIEDHDLHAHILYKISIEERAFESKNNLKVEFIPWEQSHSSSAVIHDYLVCEINQSATTHFSYEPFGPYFETCLFNTTPAISLENRTRDGRYKKYEFKINISERNETRKWREFFFFINFTIPNFIYDEGDFHVAWFRFENPYNQYWETTLALPTPTSIPDSLPEGVSISRRINDLYWLRFVGTDSKIIRYSDAKEIHDREWKRDKRNLILGFILALIAAYYKGILGKCFNMGRRLMRSNFKMRLSWRTIVLIALIVVAGLSVYLTRYANLKPYAENLTTEIIGAILIVYFIDYFLKKQDKEEWGKVGKYVLRSLGVEIRGLITDIMMFCETETSSAVSLPDTKPETMQKCLKENFYQRLDELHNKEEIRIKGSQKSNLLKENTLSLFESRRNKISNIEAKYLKFINPKIIKSLVEIQDELENMKIDVGIYTKDKRIRALFFSDEEAIYELIASRFKKIIDEAQNIKEQGMKIFF